MKKLISNTLDLIDKYSTGKIVIILFILTQIIYFLMLLYTIPIVANYANGMEIFDLQPTGFSADYALSLLESLGVEGREYYLWRQIPLDFLYPLLFGVTYSLLLGFLFKKAKINNKYFYLTLVPLFAGLFDYMENIGIIFMLNSFPSFSINLANVTSFFSILKSISTTIFFVLLFIQIVALVLNRYKNASV